MDLSWSINLEPDLAGYRVIRRRPVRAEFCGEEFLSNPPPSRGGELIAYGLPLLQDEGVGQPGTAEAIAALARVMRQQATRLRRPAAVVSRGTTHISVIDGNGNAVGLTASTGSGSGVVVPGTGIHLNNMIGEFELERAPRAGTRLSSMMSPTVVLRDGRPHLVVGSAGSHRLRGAVMQIVVNVERMQAEGHDFAAQAAAANRFFIGCSLVIMRVREHHSPSAPDASGPYPGPRAPRR